MSNPHWRVIAPGEGPQLKLGPNQLTYKAALAAPLWEKYGIVRK